MLRQDTNPQALARGRVSGHRPTDLRGKVELRRGRDQRAFPRICVIESEICDGVLRKVCLSWVIPQDGANSQTFIATPPPMP